jgi:hypothetical protein
MSNHEKERTRHRHRASWEKKLTPGETHSLAGWFLRQGQLQGKSLSIPSLGFIIHPDGTTEEIKKPS